MINKINKEHIFQAIALIFYLVFGVGVLSGQQRPENFWSNPDGLLQTQATILFEQAHLVLDKYPPLPHPNEERKLALFSLDALLHDVRLDNTKTFIDYVEKRIEHVVTKLKNENPKTNEVLIYKLYNHGYIVRTSSVTIGFDIHRGGRGENLFVTESLIQSLVNECDILFITHEHGDHADRSVTQMFVNQQKTVISPPGIFEGISHNIKYLRGNDILTEKVTIPTKNTTLTVKVFPGHQSNLINNVYAVTTPEGITVMHTGDQYNGDDMQWITQVKNTENIDILLVHCWMPDLDRAIEGISPKIIIVGHENEMMHSIDHREAFWLTLRRFSNIKIPYLVMAWGESYVYNPI